MAVPPAPERIARPPRLPPEAEALPEPYRRWLEEVEILISDAELEVFLALSADYQRDAFIREFWRSRDPYPDTARNEFRERYEGRLAEARALFPSLADRRARAMLYLGPPVERYEVGCSILWPVEAWFYRGHERYWGDLGLIFYRKWGVSHWRLWEPWEGAEALYRTRTAGGAATGCNYDAFLAALGLIRQQGQSTDYQLLLSEIEDPPKPESPEWVPTFAAYSTDLEEGAGTFDADLSLTFPGWHGSRTVVQGLLEVPVAGVEAAELGGYRSYDFVLNGEVLRQDELLESFRYKFDLPAAEVRESRIPLVFQRYLRPGGPYRLVLRLEDLASGRQLRIDERLQVPRAAESPPPPASRPASEAEGRLATANASVARGEAAVEIVEPPARPGSAGLHTGLMRFDALVVGEGVERVLFSLDGQPVLTKAAPPWSVELDLGDLPRTHTLRAAALDGEGFELASDEILLNAGGHRFTVRLTDPVPGRRYRGSVRARAMVEVPEGERLERLELYLGEERVATLYAPPFVQPLLLPEAEGGTFVRAVGHLAGGGSTEDVVWVNAPGVSEGIRVRLVELYTTVFDRERRPVRELGREAFTVREDGVIQEIRRFEHRSDLPITAAILLDVSASMEERLDAAKEAALTFFRQAITAEDRLALIPFNDRPAVAVPFTRELARVGAGLAGLKAERGTALYDSLIFSLFYFQGTSGQRALLLLSDGVDEGSRFTFDDALEYARRSRVTIYAVGLELPRRDGGARRRLERLATETGGRAFFLDSVESLARVYATIGEELRSRYLLAYQSSNDGGDEGFRTVEVDVEGRGLEAETIRGYYP